ncbi:MAG: hypothetical protein QM541_12120 [Flavobacterium sp.]|nr:hypothetical protein [Flavobacterium sp.]
MVSLFKDKSFVSVFCLILLCFAVHSHLFICTPTVPFMQDSGIISLVLTKYIKQLPPAIIGLLYIAIVLLQAIRLNILLNEYRMFSQVGFTTAMSYVLLTGIFPEWAVITPALIANSFVIWIFIQLTKLYNNHSPKSLLFNTGLIVGSAVLCYHSAVLLLIIVLFALVIVRPFVLSEWFALLLGVLMPFYIIGALLFLKDKIGLWQSFLPRIHFTNVALTKNSFFWVNVGVATFLLMLGFVTLNNNTNRMVIQVRKNWGIITVMAFSMIPLPFMFVDAGMAATALNIVPFAAIISNVFVYPKKMWWPNILFFLAIAAVIHNNRIIIKN